MALFGPTKQEIEDRERMTKDLKTLSDTQLIMAALMVLLIQAVDDDEPIVQELGRRSEPNETIYPQKA